MKKISIISTLIVLTLISFTHVKAQQLTGPQSTSSILFDGAGGKVTFPNSAPTNITEGSYGAWVKFNASASSFQRIIYKQGIELFYVSSSNKFRAEIVVDGGFISVQTTNSLSLDTAEWYHVMVTYDTTDLKIYVDGVLNNTSTNSLGAISLNSNDWGIGASPTSSIYSFNGEIDEVTLFNRALDASEIQNLVCQQVGVSDAIYSDLVAYYKFDENTGSIANDEIHANSGTLVTGTNWTTQGMPNFKPQILVTGNTLSSNITGVSYQWYFNGNPLSSDTNIIHTAQNNGDYQVEVLNEFGCLSTSDVETISTIQQVTGSQSVSSLNLNGAGGKVTVPSSAAADIAEGSFGAWVKFNAFGSTYQRIIYKEGLVELFYYEPLKRFEAEIVVNSVRHEVYTDSTTFTIDTAQWYHIMVTYDTTDFKIYVDGNLESTNSTPQGTIDSQPNSWGIGASPSSGAWSFNGEIDEVTLFGRALNSSEVPSLICNQIDVANPLYADLVAYYKFDENTGTTTTDEINANDGNLNSGVTWTVQGMPNFKPQVLVNVNTLSSNINGVSYQWYYNGSPLASDTNNTHAAQNNGDYQVEVLSKFGCLGMSDIETVVITSINEVIGINNQVIYPNPSSGIVNISNTNDLVAITFIDVAGRVVHSTKNTSSINISHLKPGVYFVKITDTNKKVTTHKLYLN
jgi:concanavalin A-like lectin/glucanase superfamily protein/type IX secretion system substrate protein